MVREPTVDENDFFLLAEDGRVIQLQKEQNHLFGRADGCLVQLADDRTSRQHAEMRWGENGFVLCDLDSTNGTRVNGDAVDTKKLEDGDIIQIGAGTFIFRQVYSVQELADMRRILRRKNTHMETSAIPSLKVAGGDGEMRGMLKSVPAPELVQLFHSTKRTGLLVMRNAEVKSFLYFKGGTLVSAQYFQAGEDEITGEEAVMKAVCIKRGHFGFKPDRENGAVNVQKSVPAILLEAARLIDEAAREEFLDDRPTRKTTRM